MDKEGTPHGGILYRSPTGDLYFRRDDKDEPELITKHTHKRIVEDRAKETGREDFVLHDLPEDILEFLNEEFGPLIGIWWVWGPTTAR